MRKIPPYAAHVPFHQLVSIACGGPCQARRWGELVLPSVAGVAPPPFRAGTPFPGMVARCLRCGWVATDNAAWVAP